jgi:PAS domain S-box-containing protein
MKRRRAKASPAAARRGGKARPSPEPRASALKHQRVIEDLLDNQEELRQTSDALRHAESELATAYDRYAELYELAPLPYLTLSRRGIVVEANNTCLLFLGGKRADLVGTPFALRLAAADRQDFRLLLARRRGEARTIVWQTHVFSAHGELPVELHMRATAGEALYTAIVDLSEREQMNIERRKLIVQADLARAASVAKDEFLASLGHELRTPLTPVLAAASGLETRLSRGQGTKAELRALVADLVKMIRRNLGYEVRLLEDLLDASRITLGKLHLDRVEVELHGVIEEAVSLVREDAVKKGVELKLKLRARNPRVFGDALRLRQALWNLLRNAIKFTPAGGSVVVESRAAAGRLAVDVHDTGIGIEREHLPHIFERFAQSPAGTRAGGLGIGLAIVRSVIQAHGGGILAESAGPGTGARFRFELDQMPRQPDRGRPARAAEPALPPAPAVPRRPTGKGRRILLVDDHEETATILADLLRSEGYQVSVAHSIGAALAAGTEGIDLLISDIGLPDGSGIDLRQRLGPRFDVPAIALSGYGRKEDVDRSRAAGFDCHLVKPVEFPALLEAMHDLGA